MLLKGIYEENGWTYADYQATWKYGYDFMLDAAQSIIDLDFRENLERVALGAIDGAKIDECLDDVRRAGNVLRNCRKCKKESGALFIAGKSRIMEYPIQLMFFNQTDVIRLSTPFGAIFKEHGDNVFTTYLCSMEIQAYCADTKRKCDQMR